MQQAPTIPGLDFSRIAAIPGFQKERSSRVDFSKRSGRLQDQNLPTTGLITGQSRDGETGLTFGNDWKTTTHETFRPPESSQPRRLKGNPRDKWIRMDRQVLRYYLYFKEAVHESPMEVQRVRKCILLYYLADDCIEIIEPKVANSGIPQGVFLQKSAVKALMGDKLKQFDLKRLLVGTNFTVLGRTFRMVDCDPSTRSFYARELCIEQPPAEVYPTEYRTGPGTSINTPHLVRAKKVDQGNTQPRFMSNDGEVLNFCAMWDDSASPFGAKRYFTLHYFLTDGTVEIREQHEPNSGRDNFPMFLSRTRVCKPGTTVAMGYSDFICGSTVDILSRTFLLLNCDTKTRAFYSERGISQVKYEIPEIKKPLPKLNPPPYNGFGSEEDSLGSFYNLVPKQPKKIIRPSDEDNYMDSSNLLRFLCKLVTNSPHDKDREFVLNFYIREQMVRIYEPPKRNSGVMGGKFLEKGKYKNPKTGCYFTAEDFREPLINQTPIEILHRTFLVCKADSFTRKFFNQLEEIRENSFAEKIVRKLVNQMLLKRVNARKIFQEADLDDSKSISASEFKALLARFDINLDDTDVRAVMAQFSDGSKEIWYSDFCDAIASYWTPPSSGQKERLDIIEEELLRKLQEADSQLRKLFRRFDEDKNGALTFTEFQTMLKHYNFRLSPYEITELMSRYDDDKEGTIDYNEFCDKVYQCDFSSPLDNGKGAKVKVDEKELDLSEYMEMLKEEEQTMKRKIMGDDILHKFAQSMSQRKYALRKMFLEIDRNRAGSINMDDFFKVCADIHPLTDDEKYYMSRKLFPDPAVTTINYETFLETISKAEQGKVLQGM